MRLEDTGTMLLHLLLLKVHVFYFERQMSTLESSRCHVLSFVKPRLDFEPHSLTSFGTKRSPCFCPKSRSTENRPPLCLTLLLVWPPRGQSPFVSLFAPNPLLFHALLAPTNLPAHPIFAACPQKLRPAIPRATCPLPLRSHDRLNERSAHHINASHLPRHAFSLTLQLLLASAPQPSPLSPLLQAKILASCTNPVRLVGYSTVSNPASRGPLHSFKRRRPTRQAS